MNVEHNFEEFEIFPSDLTCLTNTRQSFKSQASTQIHVISKKVSWIKTLFTEKVSTWAADTNYKRHYKLVFTQHTPIRNWRMFDSIIFISLCLPSFFFLFASYNYLWDDKVINYFLPSSFDASCQGMGRGLGERKLHWKNFLSFSLPFHLMKIDQYWITEWVIWYFLVPRSISLVEWRAKLFVLLSSFVRWIEKVVSRNDCRWGLRCWNLNSLKTVGVNGDMMIILLISFSKQ